jgi:hypothetical protein
MGIVFQEGFVWAVVFARFFSEEVAGGRRAELTPFAYGC